MPVPTKPIAPWEDVVLRLIAIYKLIKAALALALGITLLKFMHHGDIAAFLHDYIIEPYHLDPEYDSESRFTNWLVHDVDWLFQQATYLTPHKIRLSAYTSFFYAIVFATEGIGLYLKKHWAEYMVLIVTGSFLPLEIYLIYHKLAWWKVGLLVGNLLIIAYLIHRLRLDYYNRQAQAKARATTCASQPVTTAPVSTEVP